MERKQSKKPPGLKIQKLIDKIRHEHHSEEINKRNTKKESNPKDQNWIIEQNFEQQSSKTDESIVLYHLSENKDQPSFSQKSYSGFKIMKVEYSNQTQDKKNSLKAKQEKHFEEMEANKDILNVQDQETPVLKRLKLMSFQKSSSNDNSSPHVVQFSPSQQRRDRPQTYIGRINTDLEAEVKSKIQANFNINNSDSRNTDNQMSSIEANSPNLLIIDSIIKDSENEIENSFRPSSKKQILDEKFFATSTELKNKERTYEDSSPFNSQIKNRFERKQQRIDKTGQKRNSKTESHIVSPVKKRQQKSSNILLGFLQPKSYMTIEQEKKRGHQLMEQKSFLGHDRYANQILKLVGSLGSNRSNQKLERLKTMMSNQQNLKLKDYLRLTSLSNDKKFDKYSRSMNKSSQIKKSCELKKNDNPISSLYNKNKTAIDAQKSISLIKASIKKKLERVFHEAKGLCKQLQDNKELIGQQYQDLVFLCNFHRVFDENMFKTSDLLVDLLKQYENKRSIRNMINKNEEVTQQQIIEMISPKKKIKKTDDVTDLINRILLGLNIIKQEEIKTPRPFQQTIIED